MVRRFLLMLLGGLLAAGATMAGIATGVGNAVAGNSEPVAKPTVVLVHGEFTDTTSWDAVAAELRGRGHTVVVPENPLRGPVTDARAVAAAIAGIDGPIVLVGHAYGGAVISNIHLPNVAALVFVAAYAPLRGESLSFDMDPGRFPGSRAVAPALRLKHLGGTSVDAYLAAERFHDVYAQDLDETAVAQLVAHQRSVAFSANLEQNGPASWVGRPTWYVVATADRVIPAAAQRFMAQRAAARTTEVPASHAVLVSQPGAVADVIEQATR